MKNEDSWGHAALCRRFRAPWRAKAGARALRQGLSEEERYRVADDVLERLQQHGDPWGLSNELPSATGKGHSTPPLQEPQRES